ncbi:MAG: HAD-IIIA family hydrolase [Nocardioidaceae bacterium]
MTSGTLPTTVVIPTVGRPSLFALLDALASMDGPRPAAVVVVDDRPEGSGPPLVLDGSLRPVVVTSGGLGPAAARNRGWRLARTPWVSFLDDDVLPSEDWTRLLADDLAAAGSTVAGIQGRVSVPLPQGRRPTDWERGTAGLATAAWITADMTYRRSDLVAVGGFDERFPRAFREDADLALRVADAGRDLVVGLRGVTHPVRPVDDWVSVRVQRGNADDVLMTRLHGRDWWTRAAAPRGRLRLHALVTAAAAVGVAAAAAGRWRVAAAAAATYAVGVGEFAWARVRPGPRDVDEVTRLVVTSAVIPAAATWHALRGRLLHRRVAPWRGLPDLVLFDRDGTLVQDVPYNGDPSLVVAMPGAAEVLATLRERGIRVGLVTNQSGVARGLLGEEQVAAVNAEVERQLGPFDVVRTCLHGTDEGCGCRKPAPGMVEDACRELGVPPSRCVVIGDIASDVQAAEAAGATAILVPNPVTAAADVKAAPTVAGDLRAALAQVLGVGPAR